MRFRLAPLIPFADFADGDPVAAFGRDVKFLGGLVDGRLLVRRFDCADLLRSFTDQADVPPPRVFSHSWSGRRNAKTGVWPVRSVISWQRLRDVKLRVRRLHDHA